MAKTLTPMQSLHLCLVLISVIVAQTLVLISAGDNANIETQVDDFCVKVNGGQNVFKYTFWMDYDETQQYRVMFNSMYECTGGFNLSSCAPVASSSVSLSSLSWTFSEIAEEEDGTVNFNATSGENEVSNFRSVSVVNYVRSEFNTAIDATLSEVKFDLIINDYQWSSVDEGALLVVKFKLFHNGNQNAYFGSVGEAVDSLGNTIIVDLVDAQEEEDGTTSISKYLVFQHFTQTVTLDPAFGIKGEKSDGSAGWMVVPSFGLVSLCAALVSMVMAMM